jgi:O-antigen/teichoic acid export membrane protein
MSKKLITQNFIIYSLPSVFSKIVPFITLPITTRYLSLTDFGYLVLFTLCLIPFRVLTEYGAGYVINSNWFKFNNQERGELIFSLLIVGTVMTVVVMLLIGFISDIIFPLIIGEDWVNIKPLLSFLFLSVITFIPVTIFEFWVVIEQKAALNSIIKSIEIFFLALTTSLIAVYTQNYQYIIKGTVFVGVVLSSIQLYYLIKIIHVRFDKRYFRLIFKISSPIFLRSLFNQIRMQFDKIIVVRMFGAGHFAIYSFAGRFNQLYMEFNNSFSKAFQAIVFKGLAKNNLDIKSMRTIYFSWGYVTMLFCSFLIIFGKQLIDLLTNGLFIDAYPLLVLYTCIIALSLPVIGIGEVLIFSQKTKYIFMMTMTQASITAVLALLLIPKYGAAGGIYSFWAGSIASSIMGFLKKQQLYKQWFIEKLILPYVVIFHIIALLKYFEIGTATNFFLLAFIGVMSFHFFIMNRAFIERIFLRIRVRFVADLNQKKH